MVFYPDIQARTETFIPDSGVKWSEELSGYRGVIKGSTGGYGGKKYPRPADMLAVTGMLG